jgi:hypothetical protein
MVPDEDDSRIGSHRENIGTNNNKYSSTIDGPARYMLMDCFEKPAPIEVLAVSFQTIGLESGNTVNYRAVETLLKA